jgi:hypothetical protein
LVVEINPNGKIELDLNYIKDKLNSLEVLLTQHDIFKKHEYRAWLDDFKKIYGEKHVNLHLYCVNALIYFTGYIFVFKYILKKNISVLQDKISLKRLKEIEIKIQSGYENFNIFKIEYFNPIFSISKVENLEFFKSLILSVSDIVFKRMISPEFFFDYLIQNLIPPIKRHKSGEYYTPPFLTEMMVKNAYNFGETILDPCCGSGNFLTAVVKLILSKDKKKNDKIAAINNIYGFDINPISIYVSKLNLVYLLKDFIPDFHLNLHVFNTLFHVGHEFHDKFDLVIGNPPWYTYRDIESVDEQERVKELADQLEIKPSPKNLLNLEISTLFFYKVRDTFMKKSGKIFFVITKGVITGSHASRFRNFNGFSNIKVWTFDRKVEKVFNIDFICLFGQKLSKDSINSNTEIESYHYNLKRSIEQIEYFKNIELVLEREDSLIPYKIERKAGKVYTRKLIYKNLKKNLLPLEESYYKTLFHKGADLNPRNLIFVKCDNIGNSLVKINPDKRIFKKAKAPWNKKEFENEVIESKYIFEIIKSTELVKFYVYNYYYVFLPLSKDDLRFEYLNLDNYARLFYDRINNIYKKYKKETTKHQTLMDNLDRWSKLINSRQLSKIKVVYNNSGSFLQSAVVQGDYLVTGDLSFYATESLEEAYYLSAILNSNLITNQVKIMKSSRHIFKLPFEVPIQKFDPKNHIHLKLVELGEKGQTIAVTNVKTWIDNNKGKYSKSKIQTLLYEKLKPILDQIDDFLIKELHPT